MFLLPAVFSQPKACADGSMRLAEVSPGQEAFTTLRCSARPVCSGQPRKLDAFE
jgi:hypothetical protein